jgi:predicted SAM-dependent methyltransferase
MPALASLRSKIGTLIDPRGRRVTATRKELAAKYLDGDGIEVGALHMPLAVPSQASVRYVDRMSAADLRKHYPELERFELVDPDIVDDGETLSTVDDESLDFVIANHFIEHTQDPLTTLGNHLRVLRPGGILYLAVPDKRETFDRDREVTPLEHVALDHRDGAAASREQHYEDWARHVDKAPDVKARARQLMDEDYSIHFHVWTLEAFRELLEYAQSELRLPFALEELVPNEHEFIAILRKERRA